MISRNRASRTYNNRISGKELNRRAQWPRSERGTCGRKVFYLTEQDAEAGALLTMSRPSYRDGGNPVRAYKCPFCPGYHVGHERPSELRGWYERPDNERSGNDRSNNDRDEAKEEEDYDC